MQKIDELNKLLQGLEIPVHRKEVAASGQNLSWLRDKVLPTLKEGKLKELLSFPDIELKK